MVEDLTGRNPPDPTWRTLRWWIFGMLLAPFLPWFTIPFPMIVLSGSSLLALPWFLARGSPLSIADLLFGIYYGVVGVFLVATSVLTYGYARRGDWRRALLTAIAYAGQGATLLGVFLLLTAPHPLEPLGRVSPLSIVVLASLPAAYTLLRNWLRELGRSSGLPASQARSVRWRLGLVGLLFAALFVVAFVVDYGAAEAAEDRLPVPRWAADVDAVYRDAAELLALFGVLHTIGLLAVYGYLMGRFEETMEEPGTEGRTEPSAPRGPAA